jgi:hypothetical protein
MIVGPLRPVRGESFRPAAPPIVSFLQQLTAIGGVEQQDAGQRGRCWATESSTAFSLGFGGVEFPFDFLKINLRN